MGQVSSKRSSRQSQVPLNPSGQNSTSYNSTVNSATYPSTPTTYDPPLPPLPSESEGITQPLPPQHLNRISALVDPRDLIGFLPDERQAPYLHHANSTAGQAERRARMVESPSGRMLDHQAFLLHPNRPLTIRERQEAIRLNLERADAAEKAQKLERSLRTKPSRVFSSLSGPKNRPSIANLRSTMSVPRHQPSKANLNSSSNAPRAQLSTINLNSSFNTPRPQRSTPNLNSSFNAVRSQPTDAYLASTSTLNDQDDTIAPALHVGAFEQAKIEEGKREWEEKRAAKEEKKRKCRGACLGHCFGFCKGARKGEKA